MAINQLSFMPGYSTDPMAETEEQRRQREEQERIERESAMLASLPGVAPGAVSPLTMTPEDAANTEVSSTQIKTYGDGSQEEIVKRQIPAEGAVDPMAAQAPVDPLAQSQQNLNVLSPELTPEQQAQAAQIEAMAAQQAGAAQPMNMQQPMAQPQQQPMSMAQQAAAGLPQAQTQPVTAPAAPIAPDQAMPEIGMPPTPGPGVQVASAAPAAGVAEAAQAAQTAPAGPAWMTAANEAGNDFDKLIQVAAQFPEARGALKEKMRTALEGQRKEKEAQDIVLAAAQGDPKAQNKLQQALRPETGRKKEEVTTGDYVKAYLYARLGLNELASEAQKKIIGKQTKFGQIQVGNTKWETETDSQGRIIGARDDEGNVATENTLNKLRAQGTKTGGQVFGFTGSSVTIPAGQPDAGQEYRQRTNSVSGDVENIITTGPNAGKVYSGPPGLEKRVETSAAVSLNDAQIKFQTAPTIATAVAMMEMAGKLDNGKNNVLRDTMAKIQTMTPAIFQQVAPLAAGMATGGTTTGGTTTGGTTTGGTTTGAGRVGGTTTTGGTTTGVVGGGGSGGGGSLAAQTAAVQTAADINKAAAVSQIETKEDLEKKLNTIRINQPATEGTADSLLRTLNDVMTHPGLDKTIGNPDILNKPLQMIPSGDRRNFAQKYKQLGGQEFLAAFNQLKGGGTITEIEGIKAEQAISALKDTGISPEEFKKNSWILRDVVQTGIDNQRRQLGQPPKYAGTPQQEEAKSWLRNNPNHPKAAAVRKKLVGY
jgi:hypothetical protein